MVIRSDLFKVHPNRRRAAAARRILGIIVQESRSEDDGGAENELDELLARVFNTEGGRPRKGYHARAQAGMLTLKVR